MKRILTTIVCIILFLVMGTMLFAQDGTVSSKFNLKLYGFVRFEAIFDNTQMAVGDWQLFARPGNSSYADEKIFTMTARHTRFGMKIDGPALQGGGKINGLIEIDFAGGFPNSSTAARQPLPRLRHAWVEINKSNWALRFGQDWALISGPFPGTTNFVVGAGKGNLWMRYPQIKYTIKGKTTKFALSLNRPMAGNIKYNNFAGGSFDMVGDGERSGLPWIMARLWLMSGKNTFSVSGHYGMEKIADLSASTHEVKTFSLNADAVLNFGKVVFTGRGFMGENLNSFFGGVFQGFTRDATSVMNVASKGGWGQFKFKLSDLWSLTLGGGLDDPDEKDLNTGARTRNDWLFSNLTYSFTSSVKFMFGCDHVKTSYLNGEAGKNLRLQFVSLFVF